MNNCEGLGAGSWMLGAARSRSEYRWYSQGAGWLRAPRDGAQTPQLFFDASLDAASVGAGSTCGMNHH